MPTENLQKILSFDQDGERKEKWEDLAQLVPVNRLFLDPRSLLIVLWLYQVRHGKADEVHKSMRIKKAGWFLFYGK